MESAVVRVVEVDLAASRRRNAGSLTPARLLTTKTTPAGSDSGIICEADLPVCDVRASSIASTITSCGFVGVTRP